MYYAGYLLLSNKSPQNLVAKQLFYLVINSKGQQWGLGLAWQFSWSSLGHVAAVVWWLDKSWMI